jgi:hypothetical protein
MGWARWIAVAGFAFVGVTAVSGVLVARRA